MISWRMKLIKLIKFIKPVVDDTKNYTVFAEREYIIQNNDSVYFDFTLESNGFYFVSINNDQSRYTLRNCKRLSENQKNLFITNYYDFINNSAKGILDINNLIEVLSNENFEDELKEQNNFSKSQKEIKEKIKNYQDRKIIESQNSEPSYE